MRRAANGYGCAFVERGFIKRCFEKNGNNHNRLRCRECVFGGNGAGAFRCQVGPYVGSRCDKACRKGDLSRGRTGGTGYGTGSVRTGLDEVIPRLTVPVLGICLGMQLMCARSEEGQTEGLGIFPLDVKKFGGGVKVPHMGWNNLTELKGPLFKGLGEEAPRMYFVHSYYVPVSGFSAAVCDYGFAFSAALEKDNFFGCQFHPEKSSAMGQAVLKNFLKL